MNNSFISSRQDVHSNSQYLLNNKSVDFQQPDNSLKMFGIEFFLYWQIVNGKESIDITVFFSISSMQDMLTNSHNLLNNKSGDF